MKQSVIKFKMEIDQELQSVWADMSDKFVAI